MLVARDVQVAVGPSRAADDEGVVDIPFHPLVDLDGEKGLRSSSETRVATSDDPSDDCGVSLIEPIPERRARAHARGSLTCEHQRAEHDEDN